MNLLAFINELIYNAKEKSVTCKVCEDSYVIETW